MANPQKENGYTPIANEIMEALYRTKLSGHELRLILLVLRKTYGFQKKEDAISLSKMEDETGIHHIRCSQVIKTLQLANILRVSENINGIGKKYIFIKDFEKWDTLSENINRYKKKQLTLSEKRNLPLVKKASTKETLTKEKKERVPRIKLTDEEWLESLQSNPAYKGLDIIRIKGKCEAWCVNKQKIFTRSRLLNWLNREDVPMNGGGNGPTKPMEGNRIPEYKGTEIPCESATERARGKEVLQQIRLSIETGEAKI